MAVTARFTPGSALSVLRGLADPRLAKSAANAVAKSYRDDILGFLDTRAGFQAQRGLLRKTVRWRPTPEGAEVRASGPAGFLEFGTKPHAIKANSGVLRLAIGDRLLFRREIQHPGNRAMPFFFADGETRAAHGQTAALGVLARRIKDTNR